MIASELISNVVPVLKPEDTCLQALNWMELFRVSHLPMEQGKMYLGLVDDEMIYAHGDLNDRLDVLQIPVEGTFVYENYQTDSRDRLAINASLNYDITPDINLLAIICDFSQLYPPQKITIFSLLFIGNRPSNLTRLVSGILIAPGIVSCKNFE